MFGFDKFVIVEVCIYLDFHVWKDKEYTHLFENDDIILPTKGRIYEGSVFNYSIIFMLETEVKS